MANLPGPLVSVLHSWGPRTIIVTDGRHQVCVSTDRSPFCVRVPRVKTVDTTGAGDTFGASFVAGLIRFEGDHARAAELAVVNAAAQVEVRGSQDGLLSWADARRRLRTR